MTELVSASDNSVSTAVGHMFFTFFLQRYHCNHLTISIVLLILILLLLIFLPLPPVEGWVSIEPVEGPILISILEGAHLDDNIVLLQ